MSLSMVLNVVNTVCIMQPVVYFLCRLRINRAMELPNMISFLNLV
jgi:hypothetical protein